MVSRDSRVPQDPKEMPALVPKEFRGRREQPDRRDYRVHEDSLDLPDWPEQREIRDRPEIRERKDRLVLPEILDRREIQVTFLKRTN